MTHWETRAFNTPGRVSTVLYKARNLKLFETICHDPGAWFYQVRISKYGFRSMGYRSRVSKGSNIEVRFTYRLGYRRRISLG